jgi:hypothetical protein
VTAGEATGDAVTKMLKEIKEMDGIQNSYCLPATELEQHIVQLIQHMKDIKKNIETMWKSSIDFKDSTVAVSDLTGFSSIVNTVSFVNCQSEEWAKIGE